MHFIFWNENRIWRYQQHKFYKHFYTCDFEIWLDILKAKTILKAQVFRYLLCELTVTKLMSWVWNCTAIVPEDNLQVDHSFQDVDVY